MTPEPDDHAESDDSTDSLPIYPADGLLSELVSMVDRHDPPMSMGITFFVSGVVVSGQLIGREEYFTLLREQFKRALGVDREEGPALPANSSDEPSGRADDPVFAHLKNAHIHHGTTQLPTNPEGVLWRGQLSRVDGFILGEFTQHRT